MEQTYGKMEEGSGGGSYENEIIMELKHWFEILLDNLPPVITDAPQGVP